MASMNQCPAFFCRYGTVFFSPVSALLNDRINIFGTIYLLKRLFLLAG
jgi:hypothetical protein